MEVSKVLYGHPPAEQPHRLLSSLQPLGLPGEGCQPHSEPPLRANSHKKEVVGGGESSKFCPDAKFLF